MGSRISLTVGLVGISISFVLGMVSLVAGLPLYAPHASVSCTMAAAIATGAVSGILQAVDGIALKRMVDTWAGAQSQSQEFAFYAALAIRHIEIGVASIFALISGIAFGLFGIALRMGSVYPSWLGWLGCVAGAGTFAAGMAMAFTGFSDLSMSLSMPSGSLLLIWVLTVNVFMWRQPNRALADHEV